MADISDAVPNSNIRNAPQEYRPSRDPVMHRVIVNTEIAPGVGIEQAGWATNVPGAKVELHQLAQHNGDERGRNEHHEVCDRIYFTTASGTIYCARNREDGSWEVEAGGRPREVIIHDPATLEVGQRFISPHLSNGAPELDTSPVQDITLVDRYGKSGEYGIPFSKETTDIGTKFAQAVQARGGKVR